MAKATKMEKFTLSELAAKLKIDAKIARRRIRKAGLKKPASGWVFAIARRAEVAKIIKG